MLVGFAGEGEPQKTQKDAEGELIGFWGFNRELCNYANWELVGFGDGTEKWGPKS